jgi:hypothetical protein
VSQCPALEPLIMLQELEVAAYCVYVVLSAQTAWIQRFPRTGERARVLGSCVQPRYECTKYVVAFRSDICEAQQGAFEAQNTKRVSQLQLD